MQPKKAIAYLAIFSFIGVTALGCGRGDDSSEPTTGAAVAANQATGATNTAETLTPIAVQPRKIIYKAQETLDCDNLDTASEKLRETVKALGGYIGDAESNGTRGTIREATWTVRIPVEHYDELLKSLTGFGELESSSQKAEDVSEEFYDAQARLKNKIVEEARLIDLLKNRTGRLSDVLVVEKELSRVREEIERIQGRIQFLSNQTELSTVTITLREVKGFVPKGSPSIGTRAGRSFSDSITAMKELAMNLLIFAVAALPWLVVMGFIVWVFWKLGNRKPKAKPPVILEDE